MAFEQWSENLLVGELSDDPQFTDDLTAIIEHCTDNTRTDVLLDFSNVSHLNSSNIAKLLKLRKLSMISNERRLKLCSIQRHVWGVFLVTGLDKIFEFAADKPSGIAALQLGE